jgi:copper chaperone CopZ
MQTAHMKVTGMTCGGCTSNVTNALNVVEGVDDVAVSLSAAEAVVQYDERLTSVEQLKAAVTGAGYGVDNGMAPAKSQGKGCGCGCGCG